jgi:hypothetical protein
MINNLMPDEHGILKKYKDVMSRVVGGLFPNVHHDDINAGIDYSIRKRFKNFDLKLKNNYTNKTLELTALELLDYIQKKEPIVTSYGTLFKKHDQVPNPMAKVIQGFIASRKANKKKMFKFPKGSEMFEKYNLLQALDKIDTNGIYG